MIRARVCRRMSVRQTCIDLDVFVGAGGGAGAQLAEPRQWTP